jgi:hypothetical protein
MSPIVMTLRHDNTPRPCRFIIHCHLPNRYKIYAFLWAFAKLLKTTISFAMSVPPCVRPSVLPSPVMEQLGHTGRIFINHNNVTNSIHFHFHNHFIVSWPSTCFGRQASIFRRRYTSSYWCELRAVVAVGLVAGCGTNIWYLGIFSKTVGKIQIP